MARYRTINVDLNRQYREDLNWNFEQIAKDIQKLEDSDIKDQLLAELARIEQESIDRDNALAKQNLEALLQSIEDAKANANNAASNANLQAQYATEQGDYAKDQGDYAKNQGNYASQKGDYADEKAILADQAAANANQEASNLSQLKVDVVTATQQANSAADNANDSAQYAQTQGNYAKAQGDYAKQIADDISNQVGVTSINGKTGAVTLTASDVGAETPNGAQAKANQAETNAKNYAIPKAEKGVAGGVATLNASGKVVDASGNEVEGKVKTVNGNGPDANGNIEVPTFSGNYNDLTNKPTIPTKTSQLTNDSGFSTFSGNYDDLNNKPTIPTKTSQLENDSGFLTEIPILAYNNPSEITVHLGQIFEHNKTVTILDIVGKGVILGGLIMGRSFSTPAVTIALDGVDGEIPYDGQANTADGDRVNFIVIPPMTFENSATIMVKTNPYASNVSGIGYRVFTKVV